MYVYLIVNHVTGKYYVGQHKGNNLKKYLQDKFSQAWYELKRGRGGSSRLFNSMRKHPKDAWSIHALLSDVQTRAELDAHERDFIAFLKSQDPEYGYNICRGGEGFSGPHSLATRQKIAEASERMWERPEIRDNFTAKVKRQKKPVGFGTRVGKRRLGKKATPETIQKLRKSHIGKVRSEASRIKQSRSITGIKNHFYGKHHAQGVVAKRWRAVRCIDTDEIFPSLGHVIKRFSGNKSNLARSIRKGHLFGGKRWEYVA